MTVALAQQSAVADDSNEPVFLVKPYLQLGDAPQIREREQIEVLWHTLDEQHDWSVQVKGESSDQWRTAETVKWTRVAVENVPPHRVYRVLLTSLKPGSRFDYRLLRDENPVFTAHGKARKSVEQPCRFVVMGDCGTGTLPQKEVAYQVHLQDPDFVFIPGDIVLKMASSASIVRSILPSTIRRRLRQK